MRTFKSRIRRILITILRFLEGQPVRCGRSFVDWRTPALIRFAKLGENVVISRGASIRGATHLEIGSYSYLGPECMLRCSGGLTIGKAVFVGPRTIIMTRSHNYDTGETLPYDHQNIDRPVTIEDYVWIGAGVCIVPGVTIHEGAIVGMGAVVSKDVPPLAVVGGSPARVIKYRDQAHFNELRNHGRVRVPGDIPE